MDYLARLKEHLSWLRGHLRGMRSLGLTHIQMYSALESQIPEMVNFIFEEEKLLRDKGLNTIWYGDQGWGDEKLIEHLMYEFNCTFDAATARVHMLMCPLLEVRAREAAMASEVDMARFRIEQLFRAEPLPTLEYEEVE
jgi:hypothetical protein